MKVFEKWWNKKYPRWKEFPGGQEQKDTAKLGWKAALKWVRKHPDLDDPFAIAKAIDKELENE